MDKPQIPVPKPKTWVLDDTIQDVQSSTWQAIFGRYRNTTLGLILGGIAWLALMATLTPDLANPGIFAFFAALPFFLLAMYYYAVYNRTKHEFYRQFAAANGMQYQQRGILTNLTGALFNLGHSKKAENVITGFYEGNAFNLFTYQYTIGSGKRQTTYHCTVAQIEYPAILPSALLVVDRQYFGGIVPLFSHWEKLSSPNAFENNYDLYAQKEFEIEALQIFTPEFMEKILALWPQFNLELNDDMVFVFCNHAITTKRELEQMYQLMQYLISKIEPVVLHMKSSLEAMNAQYS